MVFRLIFLAISLILATSCSSTGSGESTEEIRGQKQIDPDSQDRLGYNKKTRTSKAGSYKSVPPKALDLPPDLVGTSNDQVAENYAEAQDELVVLPEVTTARIMTEDDRRWLEVDADVESVWKTVAEYWASSGVTLAEYNPKAGTMETEWIETSAPYDPERGMWTNLAVSLFTTVTEGRTSFDKYRMRFERLSPDQTAIYVTHRNNAKMEVFYPRRDVDYEWVESESDPESVADLLQNIIVYLDDFSPTAS